MESRRRSLGPEAPQTEQIQQASTDARVPEAADDCKLLTAASPSSYTRQSTYGSVCKITHCPDYRCSNSFGVQAVGTGTEDTVPGATISVNGGHVYAIKENWS